jgi:hypothetical protein
MKIVEAAARSQNFLGNRRQKSSRPKVVCRRLGDCPSHRSKVHAERNKRTYCIAKRLAFNRHASLFAMQ